MNDKTKSRFDVWSKLKIKKTDVGRLIRGKIII